MRDCAHLDWQKQEDEKAPKYIYLNQSGMMNKKIFDPERFNVTMKDCTLSIKNLKLTDSGKFICTEISPEQQESTRSATLVVLMPLYLNSTEGWSNEVTKMPIVTSPGLPLASYTGVIVGVVLAVIGSLVIVIIIIIRLFCPACYHYKYLHRAKCFCFGAEAGGAIGFINDSDDPYTAADHSKPLKVPQSDNCYEGTEVENAEVIHS